MSALPADGAGGVVERRADALRRVRAGVAPDARGDARGGGAAADAAADAGGTMSGPRRVILPPPHPGQEKLHRLRAKLRVGVCGRRFGKTFAAQSEAVWQCLSRPERVVWWIAPLQRQAERVEEETVRRLRRVLSGRSRERHQLRFPNGSRLEFLSAHDPNHLRGEGLDFLVVDEAADVSEYAWAEVLRPMLVDRRGQALIVSTPRRPGSWLHREYLRGLDPAFRGLIASLQLPTAANPHVSPKELEAARRLMSRREYRREFEAEFIGTENAVFPNVAESGGRPLLEQGRPGVCYVTGADLARRGDYTVLCSISSPGGEMDGFARFHGVDWAEQEERIVAHVNRFPGPCVVDATGVGDPVYERLRGRLPEVVPFRFTRLSKDELVRGLQTALAVGRIGLADEPVLRRELQVFECRVTSTLTGAVSYGAPEGFHDDCVTALALAWWGVRMGLGAAVSATDFVHRARLLAPDGFF